MKQVWYVSLHLWLDFESSGCFFLFRKNAIIHKKKVFTKRKKKTIQDIFKMGVLFLCLTQIRKFVVYFTAVKCSNMFVVHENNIFILWARNARLPNELFD